MSLLGIDLGTTGAKAGVFGLDGRCLAQAYREYNLHHPHPDWSELDSAEVWRKTMEIIAEVAPQAHNDPITALSISAFGEAVVPVTRDRNILDFSILCSDNRGYEHIDRLTSTFGREHLYSITPNLPGPQYSLPKLLWLREHRQQVYDRADYFLLWADFIAFMLGAEAVTNNSHANRTLLFDVDRNDWSDILLAWSGIPRGKLGPVIPGGICLGTVAPQIADALGLPKGIRIVSGGHDQCCNALGCGAIEAGTAVYGLGSFDCITPVFTKPAQPSLMLKAGLNIEHHVLPGLYVAFIFNQSGLLVKWFRDTFAADMAVPSGTDIYSLLDREIPDKPTRLLVLPHFEPSVFPHYVPGSSGVIAGLSTSTRRGEILKAIRECSTLYFVESLTALQEAGNSINEFIASGGGARSDTGLQIRADVLGIPVVRPRITEAGVLGAAMLAGMATGIFDSAREATARFVHPDRTFEPDGKRHAFYQEKHKRFRQLYPALNFGLSS
jgi:xylulokinase